MNERKMQFRLGVLVVAVVLIAAIMIMLLGTPDTFKQGYPLKVSFQNAGGVEVGTPVRHSGILIGRVVSVDLAEDGGAVVTLSIDHDRKILPHQTFRIALTSVLGDVQLEVTRKDAVKHVTVKTEKHPDGENVLVGEEPLDPMREVKDLSADLTSALRAVTKTGDTINEFIGKTDAMLYGDGTAPDDQKLNIGEIVKNLDETVREAKKSFENINNIVGDEQARDSLKTAINTLPELVNNTNAAIDKMDVTFVKINNNLAGLEKLTERLGERGPTMVENIDASLLNVRTMTESLAELTAGIDNSQGTLGKLIHDDSLYYNLNQASKNIRDLTVKLKPIVNDARVITDRMARHPGAIIRDAVRPGDGTKGLPGEVAPAGNYCPVDEGQMIYNEPVFETGQPARATSYR